jgi:hypothetical protein
MGHLNDYFSEDEKSISGTVEESQAVSVLPFIT